MAAPAMDDVRAVMRGEVIGPQDDGYDDARTVYNAMIDRRPDIIVRAADVADVIEAVNLARDGGLDLAIRGGGHSVPGFATVGGGVVIDLANMKGVRVDSSNETVRAEGGCTWGDYDHATHP